MNTNRNITTDIEISKLLKHFFYTFQRKREILASQNCIMVPYNFYSVNEVNICEKIKMIPYFCNKYNILYDYKIINASEMTENNKIKIVDINTKYLLLHYKRTKQIDFYDYLFQLKTVKKSIHFILDSLDELLDNIKLLNDHNICFFHLSEHKIIFNMDLGGKLMLKDFKHSLQISKLNENYFSKMMDKIEDYTYKPLEVHVLFYLIRNNLETLSETLIAQMVDNYVRQLSVLSFFSQNYNTQFKIECIKCLKKYIDIPKKLIIEDIIEYNDKWDIYSISLLYLHIIGKISQFFSLKDTFINKLIILLNKNIQPDPSKRENIADTKEKYQQLFIEYPDWSFINKLSNEKMKKLIEIIT